MVEKSGLLITDQKRADFLRDAAWARQKQSQLVTQSHAQNLAWSIIYVVTEALFRGQNIFVTDIFHVIKTSKSTTIKAIDRLVLDKVLDRRPDEIDKRRKILTINRTFKPKILSFIDEMITRLTVSGVVEKIDPDTELDALFKQEIISKQEYEEPRKEILKEL